MHPSINFSSMTLRPSRLSPLTVHHPLTTPHLPPPFLTTPHPYHHHPPFISGRIFYVNQLTNETSWERPNPKRVKPPPGWRKNPTGNGYVNGEGWDRVLRKFAPFFLTPEYAASLRQRATATASVARRCRDPATKTLHLAHVDFFKELAALEGTWLSDEKLEWMQSNLFIIKGVNAARRELFAGTAPGWAEHVDPGSGRTFYVHSATGTTQWEPPASVHISSSLLSSYHHVTTPHTTLAPHIISLSLATLCFEKSSALSPPKSPKSPTTHPRKKKGKVIKKGGKAAATFFLTMTAVAVDKKQSAKDCQRMMSEVKGEDGAKGDRDARIAGAIGKGVGTVAKTGLKMATSSIPGLYTSRWIGGVY